MIDSLDGAKVLMISDKGNYHRIKNPCSDDAGIEIRWYAICQYNNDSGVFLFSCNENKSIEGDTDFDNVDDAMECAERWAGKPIKWSTICR